MAILIEIINVILPGLEPLAAAILAEIRGVEHQSRKPT
jgi:hypothetical protein